MAQIKNLIARWDAAWPSPMIISRQYDNCQFRIDLMNYPEPEYIVDEQTEQMEILSYYLIVWMKETEDGEYREMSPIMLPGPYWIVPNQYTQLVQDIRFQFCVQSDSTDYEAHSAIFTGRIVDSIEHDGTAIDVIPVEMFDAYKAYIQEIAMAAGAVVIDPNLDTAGAAADAKAVGDAIKAGKTFVVQVPGSATVYSGSITAGDFAKALAAYTAGSGVYAVKDSEVYQLSAVSSSTMTFTQMYHGTMNFIKQIQITSADTFTVTNTALSSSAADTSYSNTASGLAATNVQAAIDESAAALSNTNGRLDNVSTVLHDNQYNFGTFVQGVRYAASPTAITASSTRCTTMYGIQMHADDTLSISVPTGFKIAVVTPSTESGWRTEDYTYTASASLKAYVNVAKTDDSAIAPADISLVITFADKSSRITMLESDNTANKQAIGAVRITEWVDGGYIKTSDNTYTPTPYANVGYRYALVSCSPGDIFTINGTGGSAPRLWAFADASNNILARSTGTLTATNLIITAPANTATLILNDQKTGSICFKGETVAGLREDVTIIREYMRTSEISIPWELGNISLSNNTLNYGNDNRRVRTPQGYSVSMQPGDTVGLTDYTNAKYYVYWIRANGTIGYHNGWLTADYTITESGNYVFLIANLIDTVQTDYHALATLFQFSKTETATNLRTDIDKNAKLKKRMWDYLLMPCGPKFLMHRGLSAEAPENTIPAFELAGQGGAWGIETDLWRTTDGTFVCFHDSAVDRMTDGTGNIADMTYTEVQTLTIDAGSNVEQYPGLKIPTLDAYLQICRRYGCVAAMEIKQYFDLDDLVSTVETHGMIQSCFFITGSFVIANALRRVTDSPIAVIGFSTTDKTSLINNAADHVNYWVTLDMTGWTAYDFIALGHSNGIPVIVYNIDDAQTADAYFRNGADVITSNSITKLT